ncbi:hypothetical protein COB55_01265 [Candidatus Wolfebacteria bacterium]|nr:MAG: hypothetical protein COB55_01265 [Candidatus Wolfebacteria bacterium]
MGLKNFLMKKAMQSKMKDVPQDQQDKAMAMVEKDPELFQKIALEVQEEVKGGKDQMTATMNVMKKYQDQLKGLM